MKSFNAAWWWTRIQHELSALDLLHSIADDRETLAHHLDGFIDLPSGESLALTDKECEALLRIEHATRDEMRDVAAREAVSSSAVQKYIQRQRIVGSIMSAFATYRRQTLVVAVTYKEVMVEDFLRTVFSAKPEAMYEYLGQSKDQKGKVDLKDVLATSSRNELLNWLALQSAKQLGNADLTTQAKCIRRITKHGLDEALVERLEQLRLRRNSLVHEAEEFEIGKEEAKEALMTVLSLAEQLGSVAKAAGLRVKLVDDPGEDDTNDEPEDLATF